MFGFMKKKESEPVIISTELATTPSTPIEAPKEKEKWVWVEGYKGTNEDMQGYDNFQYELNKEYSTEEPVEMCKNGFHCCLTLADALSYYPWIKTKYSGKESNRYFKVKALVKQSDVDKYGTSEVRYYGDDICRMPYTFYHNKLAAKQIILTEEITGTMELLEEIKHKNSSIIISNLEEFKEASRIGYKQWHINYLKNKLKDKYSELFIQIFFERVKYEALEEKVKEALMYIEEGVSKDVAVYLLMRKL